MVDDVSLTSCTPIILGGQKVVKESNSNSLNPKKTRFQSFFT